MITLPPALRALSAVPRHALGLALVAALAFVIGLSVLLAPSPPLGGPARANTPQLRAVAALPGRPPAPEPLQFKPVTPSDARTINAVMPFADAPNPKARALAAKFADPADRERALECLTAAVYYEAAVEGAEGQRAVAQVVLNRLRHPAYPKTVCGVVFQGSERSTGCQFTFTCDGALARPPIPGLWKRARDIAWGALSGHVYAPVGWSTHYHTDWVVPYWASSLAKATKVGTHIFYRWTGGWGRPPAFRGRYAGIEPTVAKLALRNASHAPTGEVPALVEGEQAVAMLTGGEAAPAGTETAPGADTTAKPVSDTQRVAFRLPVSPPVPARADGGKPLEELRWSLTGKTTASGEPAFGRAFAVKSCDPARANEVAVGKDKPGLKVRERCAG